MTSTNDGKDVKSNQTSGQKGKTYYIELYKSLDANLNAEGSLSERVAHLGAAWRRVHTLCLHSAPSTHPHLLAWIQRHTARTVFQSEWQSGTSKDEHEKLDEAINDFIHQCQDAATDRDGVVLPWESQLVARAEWFKAVLGNPWEHPVLKALLEPKGRSVSTDEILEWLKEERGVVFAARLRQLALSKKCVDIALALLTPVMDRVRASREVVPDYELADEEKETPEPMNKEPTFRSILSDEAGFNEVWDLLTDMEFVLLHKCDRNARVIDLAKVMPLGNGYQVVERLLNKLEVAPKEKRIWKNAKDVATLIIQVMITRCMVVPRCSGQVLVVLYWMGRALVRAAPPARVPRAAAALCAPARSARHLHTLANAVHAQQSHMSEELKPYVVELYVRAITSGMNELEKLKLKPEYEEKAARATEQTLASWFIQLGQLLSRSARMKCECILTAFSVHPSPAMYERINTAPALPATPVDIQPKQEPEVKSEFGSWANDSRTQTNLVKTSEHLNMQQTQHQANVLSTTVLNEGEVLGLDAELCQDIIVLLSGPRVKTLSWDMDRHALLEDCRSHMERTHFGTRTLTTELKYLNLDPAHYQHLPEDTEDEDDMYYGIEKGYEHLVEIEPQPEEIWEDAYDPERTNSSFSIYEEETTERKKKSKLQSSDSESDPLSLVAEKKDKKKERPHSKERSKERKKKSKEDKSKDVKDKDKEHAENRKDEHKDKKKEKKERKKREKKEKQVKSPLIGMKVTKMSHDEDVNVCDSHSKASMPSEVINDSIVYDGQFFMDELKSPEKPTESAIPDVKNQLTAARQKAATALQNAQMTYIGHISLNKPNTEAKLPANPSHIPNMGRSNVSLREEVKKSISRLIQFRRHKMGEALSGASSSPQQPSNSASSSFQKPSGSRAPTPPSPLIGTKVAHTNLVFNKQQHDLLNTMRGEANAFKAIFYPPSETETASCSRMLAYSRKVPRSPRPDPIARSDESLNLSPQKPILNTYGQRNLASDLKSPPQMIQKSPQRDKTHLSSYERFLQDLQKNANAGLFKTEPTTESKPKKKQMKPISRVAPVIPNIKTESKVTAHVSNAVRTENIMTTNVQNIKPEPRNNQVVYTVPEPDLIIKSEPRVSQAMHTVTKQEPTTKTEPRVSQAMHTLTKQEPTIITEPRGSQGINTVTKQKPTIITEPRVSQAMHTVIKQKPTIITDPRVSQAMHTLTKQEPTIKTEPRVSQAMHIVTKQKPTIITEARVSQAMHTVTKQEPTVITEPRVSQAMHTVAKQEPTISPQCAKIVTQPKKVDIVPNTFARLSYMHKNKLNEKYKQQSDATSSLHNDISEEIDRRIADLRSAKVKAAQNKIDYSLSRVMNAATQGKPKETPRVEVQKIDTSTSEYTNQQHPLLSEILRNNNVTIVSPKDSQNALHKPRIITQPKNTALTEKDQQDLLRLLGQKNILNKPQIKINAQTKILNNQQYVNNSSGAESNKFSVDSVPVLANRSVTLSMPVQDKASTTSIPTTTVQNQIKTIENKEIPQGQPDGKGFNFPIISNTTIMKTTAMIRNKVQKPPNQQKKTKQKATKQVNVTQNTVLEVNKNEGISKKYVPKPPIFTPKCNEDPEEQDWTKVLDAIRAHKTPSRGPNALDMLLKKDSFEKMNERNQRVSSPSPAAKNTLIPTPPPTMATQVNSTIQQTKSSKPSTINAPVRIQKQSVLKKNAVKLPKQQNVADKKIALPNPEKLCPEETKQSQPQELHKEADPFISGIPNSDYEILEELMDDDLRQEIGELLSDEESYCAPAMPASKTCKNNESKNQHVGKKVKRTDLVISPKPNDLNSLTANTKAKPQIISNEKVDIRFKNLVGSKIVRQEPTTMASKLQTGVVYNVNNTLASTNNTSTTTSSMIYNTAPTSAVQNVVIINPYGTTCNVNQSYVAVNNTPNVIYQRFMAPSPDQIIIRHNYVPDVVTPAATINVSFNNNLQSVPSNVPLLHIPTTPIPTIPVQTYIPKPKQAFVPANVYESENKTNVQIRHTIEPNNAQKSDPKIASPIPSNTQEHIPNQPYVPSNVKQSERKTDMQIRRIIESNNTQKSDPKVDSQIPSNTQQHTVDPKLLPNKTDTPKTNERKVLSEVQELLTKVKVETKVTDKIDPASIKHQRSSIVSEKNNQACKDKERLIEKRLSIINRNISSRSSYQTIPLTYTPLISSRSAAKTNEKHSDMRNKDTPKLENTTKIKPLITENAQQTVSLNTNHNRKEDEIKSSCRRILLRSSNKIEMGTIVPKSNKGRLKDSITAQSQKPEENKLNATAESKVSDVKTHLNESVEQANNHSASKEKEIEVAVTRVSKILKNKKIKKKQSKVNKVNSSIDVLKTIDKKPVYFPQDKSTKFVSTKENEQFHLSGTTQEIFDIEDAIVGAVISKVTNTDEKLPKDKNLIKATEIKSENIPYKKNDIVSGVASDIIIIPSSSKTCEYNPLHQLAGNLTDDVKKHINTEKLNAAVKVITENITLKTKHDEDSPLANSTSINLYNEAKTVSNPEGLSLEKAPANHCDSLKFAAIENTSLRMENKLTVSHRLNKLADDIESAICAITESAVSSPLLETLVDEDVAEAVKQTTEVKANNQPLFEDTSSITSLTEIQSITKSKITNMQRTLKVQADTLVINEGLTEDAPCNTDTVTNKTNQISMRHVHAVNFKKPKLDENNEINKQLQINLRDDKTDNTEFIKYKEDHKIIDEESNLLVANKDQLSTNKLKPDKLRILSQNNNGLMCEKDTKKIETEVITLDDDTEPTDIVQEIATKYHNKKSVNTVIDQEHDTCKIKYQENVNKEVHVKSLTNAKTAIPADDRPFLKSIIGDKANDAISLSSESDLDLKKSKVIDIIKPVTTHAGDTKLVKEAVPQHYKDSIKIEEIPIPGNTNPLKRCVRIVLPNNKTFKATVQGKVNVSFDTLFEEPALKNILLSSLSEKKRYLLNIQQLSTTDHRIVDTQVHGIDVRDPRESRIPTGTTEIVNLISDDEEEIYQTITMESGSFKVKNIDEETFNKHQTKLRQKCAIKLQRCDYKRKTKVLVQALLEDLAVTKPPPNEVIEIDSSSEDESSQGQTGIDILKDLLLKELGVAQNDPSKEQRDTVQSTFTGERPSRSRKSKYQNNSRTASAEPIKRSSSQPKGYASSNTSGDKSISQESYSKIITRDCSVKLINCDNLVKEMREKAKERKDVIDDDAISCLSDDLPLISRSGSFSILNELDSLNEPLLPRDEESSPVIRVFETINALGRLHNSGKNSPVMEAFDMIVDLQHSYRETSYITDICEHKLCKSEWFETKRSIHLQDLSHKTRTIDEFFEETVQNKHDIPIDCETDTADLSIAEYENVHGVTFTVPRLTTIMSKYFENNPIIYHLNNIASTDDLPKTPLKRKLQDPIESTSNKLPKTFYLPTNIHRVAELKTVAGKEQTFVAPQKVKLDYEAMSVSEKKIDLVIESEKTIILPTDISSQPNSPYLVEANKIIIWHHDFDESAKEENNIADKFNQKVKEDPSNLVKSAGVLSERPYDHSSDIPKNNSMPEVESADSSFTPRIERTYPNTKLKKDSTIESLLFTETNLANFQKVENLKTDANKEQTFVANQKVKLDCKRMYVIEKEIGLDIKPKNEIRPPTYMSSQPSEKNNKLLICNYHPEESAKEENNIEDKFNQEIKAEDPSSKRTYDHVSDVPQNHSMPQEESADSSLTAKIGETYANTQLKIESVLFTETHLANVQRGEDLKDRKEQSFVAHQKVNLDCEPVSATEQVIGLVIKTEHTFIPPTDTASPPDSPSLVEANNLIIWNQDPKDSAKEENNFADKFNLEIQKEYPNYLEQSTGVLTKETYDCISDIPKNNPMPEVESTNSAKMEETYANTELKKDSTNESMLITETNNMEQSRVDTCVIPKPETCNAEWAETATNSVPIDNNLHVANNDARNIAAIETSALKIEIRKSTSDDDTVKSDLNIAKLLQVDNNNASTLQEKIGNNEIRKDDFSITSADDPGEPVKDEMDDSGETFVPSDYDKEQVNEVPCMNDRHSIKITRISVAKVTEPSSDLVENSTVSTFTAFKTLISDSVLKIAGEAKGDITMAPTESIVLMSEVTEPIIHNAINKTEVNVGQNKIDNSILPKDYIFDTETSLTSLSTTEITEPNDLVKDIPVRNIEDVLKIHAFPSIVSEVTAVSPNVVIEEIKDKSIARINYSADSDATAITSIMPGEESPSHSCILVEHILASNTQKNYTNEALTSEKAFDTSEKIDEDDNNLHIQNTDTEVKSKVSSGIQIEEVTSKEVHFLDDVQTGLEECPTISTPSNILAGNILLTDAIHAEDKTFTILEKSANFGITRPISTTCMDALPDSNDVRIPISPIIYSNHVNDNMCVVEEVKKVLSYENFRSDKSNTDSQKSDADLKNKSHDVNENVDIKTKTINTDIFIYKSNEKNISTENRDKNMSTEHIVNTYDEVQSNTMIIDSGLSVKTKPVNIIQKQSCYSFFNDDSGNIQKHAAVSNDNYSSTTVNKDVCNLVKDPVENDIQLQNLATADIICHETIADSDKAETNSSNKDHLSFQDTILHKIEENNSDAIEFKNMVNFHPDKADIKYNNNITSYNKLKNPETSNQDIIEIKYTVSHLTSEETVKTIDMDKKDVYKTEVFVEVQEEYNELDKIARMSPELDAPEIVTVDMNSDCIDDDEIIAEKTIEEVECDENIFGNNVTLVYKDVSGVILKGIEYEDPEMGTCYVFPLEKSSDESGSSEVLNGSVGSTIEVLKELEISTDEKDTEFSKELYNESDLRVLKPKLTYSKRILKRKSKMKDVTCSEKRSKRNSRSRDSPEVKITGRRYRKGKNIDAPKLSATAIAESGNVKDFKRRLDYYSAVSFSYSITFSTEFIDAYELLHNWPIRCAIESGIQEDEIDHALFNDLDKVDKTIQDPLQQTLVEEITADYYEADYPNSQTEETNFNMGFGEGSGRVIQNLCGGTISNFSAATLSDVKHTQPCLLSEKLGFLKSSNQELQAMRRYLTYVQLKNKVRSFFKNTTFELTREFEENIKDSTDIYNASSFPFELFNSKCIEPFPIETVVQVVQVGQLPVSAAAQNPVTCDPRVTQVSDASPSQCTVENSPHDDSQPEIKTEYTELTTADLNLPMVDDYVHHNQNLPVNSRNSTIMSMNTENIPIETELVKSEVKIELEEESPEEKENENNELSEANNHTNNVDYLYNANNSNPSADSEFQALFDSDKRDTPETVVQQKPQNGSTEKTDQIAHAMNAAGITTSPETANTRAQALVNILTQKLRQGAIATTPNSANNYNKTTSINAMSLQQALASMLPPPLNQTSSTENNQQGQNTVTPQVLHIVQGKTSAGNQITLVDNSQQSVITTPNTTPVLHIVQNKAVTPGQNSNSSPVPQSNTFSGLSLVDAGLQQGGNQLLHIVNTGNQKNNNAGQLLKRVNLLTNLANIQGSNEQKMVQFVCKSADGKAIQLNAPHQRSMVLRLQPIESTNVHPATPKPTETNQDLSPTQNSTSSATNKDSSPTQQEIKSRSVYEENYAKFIQNSSNKPTLLEKSNSLPKFNQAFGKAVFQDGNQKQNEINSNSLPAVNASTDSSECSATENPINLDHIGQISSPPLLLRKSPVTQTTQSPQNLVQQIKQTIGPMNIQTMHGGVIYTRQIPVNIGGGQTINLITVPSTELIDESGQKQQVNQGETIEPSIIKIVPQSQPPSNAEVSDEMNNDNAQQSTPQPQPVLTQMRIKLPMLSKTPQMVSGTRVVRPSFFQIQRNVIGGANQVYQQLVLTAAPPLGQQTIRLPQAQARQIKVPENQSSSESQMSSSTLEQLREFDMVLEQVKERSTVQPISNLGSSFKLHTPSTDTTDSPVTATSTSVETTQVLYSIGSSQPLNVTYVNRKPTVSTSTTSTFVRSPDSSGIADSPTSSSHSYSHNIPHTSTSEASSSETTTHKPVKVSSKSKSRPKSSSHPPNSIKLNSVPPKTSTQKPLEDEQTTQRILYILAEYKEQVENSPDKDKPAPRRRTNPPSNPSGSSKRKKSSSGSRRSGRDVSPIHGDDSCRTMGSEDSSCGTSQGDCTESCMDSHSPQDSPRKVARKLAFEQDPPTPSQLRPQPQRNVIVADGQTITVARGTSGKPTTTVLMPTNYILPVSMVKGGQQIAIVTNRGPKLLTVGGGEGGATNALLLQRLIGPAGLKPVLTRPGVRHVRLPTAALHNLQAFNLASATNIQPPDSTASPAVDPPHDLMDTTRADHSPWTDRDSEIKPDRASSPDDSEPWNLPSSADPHDYIYEETVRADNMDRTVLDPIQDRYSPDMEAQRIFDKMFDVDTKKSFIVDSPRCGYDIDASDCDDKSYQVVHKRDSHRQTRLSHVSAAALRHKYAILEHELRLQKSLSEECEDLGVDSPSASELFPEAELLFAASPAQDHGHDTSQHSHTPQPTLLNQSVIQPDIDDQIATDQLLPRHHVPEDRQELDVNLGLEDVGIVTVSEDGMQATIALDQEEFARAHPNTTFHSDPTDEGVIHPFTMSNLKSRHITSTIFHSNRAPATVLMTAPQATVISQATPETSQNPVKYSDIDNMIHSIPSTHTNNINLSSVLVKDDRLTRYDNVLTDSRELHLSNTASAIVHPTGNATQVIRRVCYDDSKRGRESFLMDEPDAIIAGDDAKMVAEDSSRDATLESMGDVDDGNSSPERHAELFWESNSASERSESRRPLEFSSDSEKCCKSPSYDETNSTDSSGVGTHMRLDSVIKEARGVERSGSADGSSADDTHPPLRTYPPKRLHHNNEGEMERSLSGKTRAGERSPDMEVRRRASGRGVVKRGCHCCNGSPAPPRPKKPRQRKPTMDFTN